MKTRAVIFDLDGTLIFLHFRYTESRKVIIETINKMGLDGSKISLGDTAQIVIEKIEKEIKGRSINLQISEIKKKIWSIIDNFEIESIEISELAKDTKSLLNFLSKEDIKLGIVTNNGSKGTRLALRKHGIEDYFDVI
ncbi:MAG: HAD hydrolase-like protein, partial [Candidatus Methylarchaceae archaeon HK02M2]|nr:HAD hydrolase-like protein [Candidatus Methylarchaceae archaeon HK02M2]